MRWAVFDAVNWNSIPLLLKFIRSLVCEKVKICSTPNPCISFPGRYRLVGHALAQGVAFFVSQPGRTRDNAALQKNGTALPHRPCMGPHVASEARVGHADETSPLSINRSTRQRHHESQSGIQGVEPLGAGSKGALYQLPLAACRRGGGGVRPGCRAERLQTRASKQSNLKPSDPKKSETAELQCSTDTRIGVPTDGPRDNVNSDRPEEDGIGPEGIRRPSGDAGASLGCAHARDSGCVPLPTAKRGMQ